MVCRTVFSTGLLLSPWQTHSNLTGKGVGASQSFKINRVKAHCGILSNEWFERNFSQFSIKQERILDIVFVVVFDVVLLNLFIFHFEII